MPPENWLDRLRGAIGEAGTLERPVDLLARVRVPDSPCSRPNACRFSRAVRSG